MCGAYLNVYVYHMYLLLENTNALGLGRDVLVLIKPSKITLI